MEIKVVPYKLRLFKQLIKYQIHKYGSEKSAKISPENNYRFQYFFKFKINGNKAFFLKSQLIVDTLYIGNGSHTKENHANN